jgi:hypothetical protein
MSMKAAAAVGVEAAAFTKVAVVAMVRQQFLETP